MHAIQVQVVLLVYPPAYLLRGGWKLALNLGGCGLGAGAESADADINHPAPSPR